MPSTGYCQSCGKWIGYGHIYCKGCGGTGVKQIKFIKIGY